MQETFAIFKCSIPIHSNLLLLSWIWIATGLAHSKLRNPHFSQFVSLRRKETQFVMHDVGRLIHEIRMPKIRENARLQFSGTRPSLWLIIPLLIFY